MKIRWIAGALVLLLLGGCATAQMPASDTPDTAVYANEATEPSTQPVTETLTRPDLSALELELNRSMEDFVPICQFPELPTGCEITSLTMVLNYYGFDIDKETLSDDYLEKGDADTADFRVVFAGDPRSNNAYGCFAPPIADCANRYLRTQDTDLRAYDLTEATLDDLAVCVNSGIPVLVWTSIYCDGGFYYGTRYIDGEELEWYANEHCMVLLDINDGLITAADPYNGAIMNYSFDSFWADYAELGMQAVILL